MYGDNHRGVSVGIDLLELSRYLSQHQLYAPVRGKKHITVGKMIYPNEDKTSILDAILANTYSHKSIAATVNCMFLYVYALLKDEGFIDEGEQRIIMLDNIDSMIGDQRESVNLEMRERARQEMLSDEKFYKKIGIDNERKVFEVIRDVIRPHYPLDISECITSIIPEIVLGCKSPQREEMMRVFLDLNGMSKTNIVRSQKKYR